ncbi:hypothetical protein BDN70DRAFT_700289 [Pholiota conissans]|uniref:Uncharacterized protein n=1 Tax=Pholiota conissans TaxID=109636 RepID=A0A9P6D0E9_9AGAR|nr:hypothetical protein BDN70DRAFT_700289 [Pholiota conissans]
MREVVVAVQVADIKLFGSNWHQLCLNASVTGPHFLSSQPSVLPNALSTHSRPLTRVSSRWKSPHYGQSAWGLYHYATATSAFITGIYTAAKRIPHSGLLVAAAAVNSAITGAAFFSVREFGVSPVLTRVVPWEQYAHRRRELGIDTASEDDALPSKIALSEVRKNKLLDSGMSGAIAGAFLRGIRSGRVGIIPGLWMGAVAGSLIQYGVNEMNIMRLRYIAKLHQENRTAVEKPTVKPRQEIQIRDSTTTWMDTFLRGIGLEPITDDEYISKMKKTRDVYLKRIAELETQLEKEKSRQDSAKS